MNAQDIINNMKDYKASQYGTPGSDNPFVAVSPLGQIAPEQQATQIPFSTLGPAGLFNADPSQAATVQSQLVPAPAPPTQANPLASLAGGAAGSINPQTAMQIINSTKGIPQQAQGADPNQFMMSEQGRSNYNPYADAAMQMGGQLGGGALKMNDPAAYAQVLGNMRGSAAALDTANIDAATKERVAQMANLAEQAKMTSQNQQQSQEMAQRAKLHGDTIEAEGKRQAASLSAQRELETSRDERSRQEQDKRIEEQNKIEHQKESVRQYQSWMLAHPGDTAGAKAQQDTYNERMGRDSQGNPIKKTDEQKPASSAPQDSTKGQPGQLGPAELAQKALADIRSAQKVNDQGQPVGGLDPEKLATTLQSSHYKTLEGVKAMADQLRAQPDAEAAKGAVFNSLAEHLWRSTKPLAKDSSATAGDWSITPKKGAGILNNSETMTGPNGIQYVIHPGFSLGQGMNRESHQRIATALSALASELAK